MQGLVSKGVSARLLGEKRTCLKWKSNGGSTALRPLSRVVSRNYSKKQWVACYQVSVKSGEWQVGEAVELHQTTSTSLAVQGPSTTSHNGTFNVNRITRGLRKYSTQVNGTGEAKETGKEKDREFGATPLSESKQTIDQFRDGMRKDQSRLSMEPEELKQGLGVTSPLGTSSKPTLTTGPGSRPGNTGASPASSTPTSQAAVPQVKKSGRALIFVFIILGIVAGFLVVGEVGGWIDEYNGDDFKRKNRSGAEKKDWSDLSKLPTNLASSLAALDDKMVDVAMQSSFIQTIREKLGLGASKHELSSSARSLASSDPNSDENLKMRAAVVLQANKDVAAAQETSQSSNSVAEIPNHASADSPATPTIEPEVKNEKEPEVPAASTESNGEKSESSASPVADVVDIPAVVLESQEETKPSSYNESYEATSSKVENDESKENGVEASVDASSGQLEQGNGSEDGLVSVTKLKELALTEENMNLLKIENEELRSVIVSMVQDLDENHRRYEEERRKAVEGVEERLQNDFEGKLKILREEEAKRVMEILKAYEVKLEEEVRGVVEKAVRREEDIHQNYGLQVQSSLAALQQHYEEKLEEWSGLLTDHVDKWKEDVLTGVVSELISNFKSSHATRLALITHINSTLDDRIHLVETYRTVAEESAAYAQMAKFWILLQNKLSHAPNAPFFIQLQDYLEACQKIPQMANAANEMLGKGLNILGTDASAIPALLADSTKPHAKANHNALALLIRSSQLGIPSNQELKSEFLEAARASRTASLAPQDANAFQHSWASLKEMFISTTSIGTPSTSNHISIPSELPQSPISDALSSLFSSGTSNASDDEATKAVKRNWALLQKAGLLIAHDSLGPALQVLSQLDGTPASLMQPWIQKAQQKLVVQASLDFLSSQTANLPFTPLPKNKKTSDQSSL
jgi:hypothetical protein